MIRQIIFDFDGTLADSKELVLVTYNEMAAGHGFRPILLADIEGLRRLSVAEKCSRLGVPLHRLPVLAVEFNKRYRRLAGSLAFNPGMLPLLRRLHAQGLRLAVISSNEEGNIRRFLLNNRADTLISHICCTPHILGKGLTIRSFLKKHRIGSSEAIYIGDEERDVKAARKAGIRVIAVDWGLDSVELLLRAKPDYLIRRPEEIERIVLQTGS